jgi:hypothetical protein
MFSGKHKDPRMIFANTLLGLGANRKDMTVVIAPIGRARSRRGRSAGRNGDSPLTEEKDHIGCA